MVVVCWQFVVVDAQYGSPVGTGHGQDGEQLLLTCTHCHDPLAVGWPCHEQGIVQPGAAVVVVVVLQLQVVVVVLLVVVVVVHATGGGACVP